MKSTQIAGISYTRKHAQQLDRIAKVAAYTARIRALARSTHPVKRIPRSLPSEPVASLAVEDGFEAAWNAFRRAA